MENMNPPELDGEELNMLELIRSGWTLRRDGSWINEAGLDIGSGNFDGRKRVRRLEVAQALRDYGVAREARLRPPCGGMIFGVVPADATERHGSFPIYPEDEGSAGS